MKSIPPIYILYLVLILNSHLGQSQQLQIIKKADSGSVFSSATVKKLKNGKSMVSMKMNQVEFDNKDRYVGEMRPLSNASRAALA